MAEEKELSTLSEEEQNRKSRVRLRLFVLLVIFDFLLVAYLIFELVSIFMKK